MNTVQVIGMGISAKDLGQRHRDAIATADLLVGGRRHLAHFPDHPAEKLEIAAPLSDVIERIRKEMNHKHIVVLASGDPLFYGIGRTLTEQLGQEHVKILPNVSVMAEAFARIGKPWADAVVVSLHGREAAERLPAVLAGNKPIFVFTDPKRTPAMVGQIVSERPKNRWRICVFERLGEADERIGWHAPEDVAAKTFREPNAVILWPDENAEPRLAPVVGGPDENYRHVRGMITKAEVRAVSLSKLRLKAGHVMWDLGAGSGAVAIEAAVFIRRGRIIAVEKYPDRVSHIRENIRRFGVPHVEVREMQLPEGIDTLPDPDRVFIGGGGSNLLEILRAAAERLSLGGRIVINLVVVETLAACTGVLKNLGFEVEVVQIQVNRGADMPTGMRLAAGNPVFVVTGSKVQGSGFRVHG